VLALYDPAGALAGFLAVDLSAHQLVFYADETFTNPQVLLQGVYNGLSTYQAAPSASQFLFSLSDTPQFAFVGVMGSDSSLTLYRVDYTGSVSSALYHFQGMIGGWLQDAQSVYFTNETSVSGSAAVSILRVPLDGSAPAQVLYTDTAVANTQQLSFVGVSGNTLVLMREPTLNSATGSVTVAGSIETLSVGAPGVPTTIASVPAEFSAALVGTNIYIDSVTPASDPAYGSVHSTQIITIDGTVVQSVMAQSSFVSDAWGAPLVQARGISDPGGLGGGSLYLLDPAAPGAASPAQVKVSGGAPFSIAAKTATAWLAPIGSNISIGSSGGNGAPGLTLIYDSLKNQIASFSVPQTDVSGVAPGN
jgi:hypothetical protein